VRLDLSDNPMTEEVAPAVAECVRRQPHLKYLNLNDTSLTDQGVKLVCSALSQPGACQELEELELALNEITPEGARSVALAVLGKPLLWRLNLRENELEDKGGVIISRAVALMPALRVLDACGNQLKRVGAVALAKAAASKPQLELLQMDDNMISEEGLNEVRFVLGAAGKLNALGSLDENMEEDDEDLENNDLDGDDELSAAFALAAIV
jgi:Ran GTPase-activating protein (RanGAP) involved in mRNA processing and transport